MQKYAGADCPYCHKPIQDADEVTVCPVCGAPYHRECAKKAGGCVLTELHEKGGQWTRVQRPAASEIDGRAALRCSRCGSVNPPGAKTCEICGTPLDNASPEPPDEPWNRPNWQDPPPQALLRVFPQKSGRAYALPHFLLYSKYNYLSAFFGFKTA